MLLEHKFINPTICNLYFTKKKPQTKGVSMHEKEQCFHDSFIWKKIDHSLYTKTFSTSTLTDDTKDTQKSSIYDK